MRALLKNIIFLQFLLLSSAVLGQENLTGEVSFITSGSIYVRFDDTGNIETGDTLWMLNNSVFSPCLQVKQKSSSSCVCIIVNDCKFDLKSKIYYRNVSKKTVIQDNEKVVIVEDEDEPFSNETSLIDDLQFQIENEKKPLELQRINARLSAATYSTIDNGDNRHRTMARLSLNAMNINDSKWSVETYANYREEFTNKDVNSTTSNRRVSIYNLAATYNLDSTTNFVLGRKINRKMSSIGAIDGIQIDKTFGTYYTGVAIGFRPDHTRFDLNTNLLQYGVYFGQNIRKDNAYGQWTLGILEQRNAGNVDRRYSYLQFSNTLFRKLSVFSSAELDLYQKLNDATSFQPRLTNLYTSLSYRFSRRISLMVSYDTRKNIIFYETFKTEIERLLDDDESRQGVRFRLNLKPFNIMNLGTSYSRRFKSGSSEKFENMNVYLSINRIPLVAGRLSLTYNRNSSSYLSSNIYSVRYYKNLISRKLDLDIYYRYVSYNYLNSESTLLQEYIGAGLNYRIVKNLSFNLFSELSKFSEKDRWRINTKIIKRF